MKTLKTILIILLFTVPAASYAQTKSSSSGETTYQRKTTKRTTKTGISAVDTIRKENAPVLEDNGSVNTTGIVDGNRSSTGRPDADTMVNYSVKRTKRTIVTGGVAMPDSTKKKKRP
ncbi:hypothetical protein [Dyadobacter sp. NIV53]|uniref:hypothetical protein n=1 Tax=Dyadobacter sp. NIV53 TaxID=2861765 RepID=UPI001C886C69|nr:hypothetical protein [Dyadobacter sp. NIV53]